MVLVFSIFSTGASQETLNVCMEKAHIRVRLNMVGLNWGHL